jgi:hypothetical protein
MGRIAGRGAGEWQQSLNSESVTTGVVMRINDPTGVLFRSASLAVIRTVQRRRFRLLGMDAFPVICRRALPLDYSESRPFEASLDRNIKAALSDAIGC